MSNYQLTKEDRENFNLFLNQYYLASINALKFIGPIIFGVFLIVALLFYIFTDGYAYTIATVLGLFIFFRIRSIPVPDLDLNKLEIFEEVGTFTTVSNAGHRVMFNNYHVYNADMNKLQELGLIGKENVSVNYVLLRADRRMIYVFEADGYRDISLPVRK